MFIGVSISITLSSMLTDQQKIQIVLDYKNGKNGATLAREYNISCPALLGLLKRRGIIVRNDQSILQRKNSVNEDYFSVIDSREKAYYLGLMYADGCIASNGKNTRRFVSRIGLQKEDCYLLERLSIILYGKDLIKYVKGKNNRCSMMGLLSVFSTKYANHLIRLGCTQRKSSTIRLSIILEKIPKELVNSFILGYFDGDGGVYLRNRNKNQKPYCYPYITSNLHFIKEISIYLRTLNIDSRTNERVKGYGNVKVDKIIDIMKFYSFLYKEAPIFMIRKRRLLDRFLDERTGYLITDPMGKSHFHIFLKDIEEQYGLRRGLFTDIWGRGQKKTMGWKIEEITLREGLKYV